MDFDASGTPDSPVTPATASDTESLLTALVDYRFAEEAMALRTGESMNIGSIDLQAIRFLVKAQQEDRIVSGRELGDHLGVTSASITTLLDRLTLSGHVQREPHPTDRRSNMLTATPGADAEVRRTLAEMHARMIDATSTLSEADATLVQAFFASMTAAVDSVDPIA